MGEQLRATEGYCVRTSDVAMEFDNVGSILTLAVYIEEAEGDGVLRSYHLMIGSHEPFE
jgi:hypothetical protein